MRKGVILIVSLLLLASCRSVDLPTVEVVGSATVMAEPDALRFTVAAAFTAPTSEEARSVSSGMINHAVSILEDDFGVPSDDIATSSLSVSPDYSYDDGKTVLRGQRAYQSVTVLLRDISAAGKVFESLSKIDGIEVSGITADKLDRSAEKAKARSPAVSDAHDRASVYATAAGYILGDVISVRSAGSTSSAYEESEAYLMDSRSSSTEYSAGKIPVSDSVIAVYSLVE